MRNSLALKKISLTFLVMLVFTGHLFCAPNKSTDLQKVITIPRGYSVQKVAQLLKKEQIIRSIFIFKAYVKISKAGNRIKAGAYYLKPAYSLPKIINILTHKENGFAMVKLTIPEGDDLNKIASKLNKFGLVDKTEFLEYVYTQAKDDFKNKYPFLELNPIKSLEGYLYPETYFFAKDISKKEIVNQMLEQFEKKMLKIWETAPTYKRSPKKRFNFHQVLTIASIVEKEARVRAESPLIASVYYNRLKKRTVLAADPTVVYALGKSYKNIVTYKDLKIDSPYNTYKYTGFPPGPIASPGKESFKAALNPEKSDYLFFVANRNGTHSFTKTYQAHLNVQKKIARKNRK
jgi:UPF0755 protein